MIIFSHFIFITLYSSQQQYMLLCEDDHLLCNPSRECLLTATKTARNKTVTGRVQIWGSLLDCKNWGVLWMKEEDCKERLLCLRDQTELWKQTLKGFHLSILLGC